MAPIWFTILGMFIMIAGAVVYFSNAEIDDEGHIIDNDHHTRIPNVYIGWTLGILGFLMMPAAVLYVVIAGELNEKEERETGKRARLTDY